MAAFPDASFSEGSHEPAFGRITAYAEAGRGKSEIVGTWYNESKWEYSCGPWEEA